MMNRKKNGILWVIIWGGLLVVILYSPIGSPEMYNAKKYFVSNQGVEFTGGVILNAPTLKSMRNNYPESTVPDFNASSELTNETTYAVTKAVNSFDPGPVNISSQGYSSLNSIKKNGYTEGSGTGESMNVFMGKTTKHNDNPHYNGFLALNTDIKGLSKNGLMLSETSTLSDPGGPDPGGGPTGDPIPVGDGWKLLLLFGVCYILLKRRRIKCSMLLMTAKK